MSPYLELPAFDEEIGQLNVIIETPKGSRNKFEYDPKHGLFKLSGILPAGANFPFDFGFVPPTLGEDGDPLDVLLLMDEPAFTGCLVAARLIGVIEAEQTERDGASVRNDRLIAVAAKSLTHRDLKSLEQLGQLGPSSGENSHREQAENHSLKRGGKGADVQCPDIRSPEIQAPEIQRRDNNDRNFRGGDILLEEIEHFFISYNTFKGKEFKPLGRFGSDRAKGLIQEGIDRFRKKGKQ